MIPTVHPFHLRKLLLYIPTHSKTRYSRAWDVHVLSAFMVWLFTRGDSREPQESSFFSSTFVLLSRKKLNTHDDRYNCSGAFNVVLFGVTFFFFYALWWCKKKRRVAENRGRTAGYGGVGFRGPAADALHIPSAREHPACVPRSPRQVYHDR